MAMVTSIATEFPKQIERCTQLLAAYRSLGWRGHVGAAYIEATLADAQAAWASGDVVRILAAFEALQGCD